MKTQNELILAQLVRCHGEWVSMLDLVEVSGSYNIHSRVSDLRAQGHVIEHRGEGARPRRSYYRITSPIQEPLPL